MNALSARRRHPFAALLVLLLALAATGGFYALLAPSQPARAAAAAQTAAIEEGRKLFITNCSSCHGISGEGSASDGPSLVGVGAAAVDFQVATGRMPLQQPNAQAPSKQPVFTQEEIDQMAAYVASLGPGPAVPSAQQYALDGDIALGGELFRTNCASCHNFTGQGGALSEGKYAPSMVQTNPKQIYEAMLTGPQAMPVFNDETMPPEAKKAIISFVKHINGNDEGNPGGYQLGRVGPVTEGIAGWVLGIGLLIGFAVWIGAKSS